MAGLVPSVKRICVLKASALGDFIQTLPALDGLRRAYPSAVITVLGRSVHAELMTGRPGPVDELLVVPDGAIGDEHVGYRRDEHERFLEGLAGRQFDIAIQLHGGGRNSNPFVAALGARISAGARTPDALHLNLNVGYDLYQPDVLRNNEIVGLVGANELALEPQLCVTDGDRVAAAQALPDEEAPLVVIHPGATDPRRLWPAERFAQVADALVDRGAHVVVTGTDAERPLVERVLGAARHELTDLCGRLTLSGLVGVLDRAVMYVGNDTGPRHLASAVGTATVAVYWIGNVITAGPLTRQRHRALVSWTLDCPVCGHNCMTDNCLHSESFVAAVPASAVADAALELFDAVRLPAFARRSLAGP